MRVDGERIFICTTNGLDSLHYDAEFLRNSLQQAHGKENIDAEFEEAMNGEFTFPDGAIVDGHEWLDNVVESAAYTHEMKATTIIVNNARTNLGVFIEDRGFFGGDLPLNELAFTTLCREADVKVVWEVQ